MLTVESSTTLQFVVASVATLVIRSLVVNLSLQQEKKFQLKDRLILVSPTLVVQTLSAPLWENEPSVDADQIISANHQIVTQNVLWMLVMYRFFVSCTFCYPCFSYITLLELHRLSAYQSLRSTKMPRPMQWWSLCSVCNLPSGEPCSCMCVPTRSYWRSVL